MASTQMTGKRAGRPHTTRITFQASSDTYFDLPAGYALSAMFVDNTTANAVTGGIDVGTTDGGVDIVSALAVGANAIKHCPEASLLLRYFSRSVAQRIYVIAHTAWNGAVVNFCFVADKVYP